MLEADKRPVSAVADHIEVRDVVEVAVAEEPTTSVTILFDPGSLARRTHAGRTVRDGLAR